MTIVIMTHGMVSKKPHYTDLDDAILFITISYLPTFTEMEARSADTVFAYNSYLYIEAMIANFAILPISWIIMTNMGQKNTGNSQGNWQIKVAPGHIGIFLSIDSSHSGLD